MDTDWFAIDDEGHVALMYSGEPGCAPVGQSQFWVADEEGLLLSMPVTGPFVQIRESSLEEELMDTAPLDAPPLRVAERGLFLFEACFDYSAAFYHCTSRPLRPLDVRDLPAALAQRSARLPGARFAEMPLVQPADFAPMRHWGPWWISLRHWLVRPSDSELRRLDQFEAVARRDHIGERSVIGRVLALDVSELVANTLSECSRFGTDNAVWLLIRDQPELLQRVLREDELRWLIAVYDQPGDEIDAQIEALAQTIRERAPESIALPLDLSQSTHGAKQHAYKSECERLFAQGVAPLRWSHDPARRFIVSSFEWSALATSEDLAHDGPMSVAHPTPALLRALAARASDVIAAESIAREVTANRGGHAHIVYWREADASEVTACAELRAESAPLRALGFAMDAVVTRVPVLLVEREGAVSSTTEAD